MPLLSQYDRERLHTLVETARHGLGHLFAYATSGNLISATSETESVQKSLELIHNIVDPLQHEQK